MAKLQNIEPSYPETFFNIPHPGSPWISIQFRTTINPNDSIDNSDHWEEITLNPSNYFDNITIEDSGGIQKVELSLLDKNFANLERIITKSIFAAKFANKLVSQKTVSDRDTGFFEFHVDNSSMVNLRIRFGYADIEQEEDKTFIDDVEFTGNYSNRTESINPVIRSPWLYLQIINAQFNLTEQGMQAQITAFSTASSFIDRAKLLKRFAVFRGTPTDILETLKNIIEQVSNGEIVIEYEDPIPITNDDGTNYIEINLGSPVNETTKSFRTLRSLFTELTSKIPAKIYTRDDTEIIEGAEGERAEEMDKTIRYSYTIEQFKDGNQIKHKIIFYYADPVSNNSIQNLIRTYTWREFSQSIVKNVNINSKVDFASLNRQVVVVDTSKVIPEIHMHVPRASDEGEGDSELRLGRADEVTDALNDNFDISFVSDTFTASSNQGGVTDISARVTQQIVHYLNQGVFEGSIELFGDPYYLFDSKVKPFQHMIRIIIMRPGYINQDGEFISPEKSYLSGHYAIGKAVHKIDSNGYSTTLDILRWPTE